MEETTRQEKERSIWDQQASVYEDRVLKIYGKAYERSIQKTRAVLTPEQQILEIGCGTGIIALGIAPHVQRVIATDLSPEMIAVAQNNARRLAIPNVEFRVSDGYALPFDDASCDTVLLFNTLHVVKEPAALLREAYRLLKPGGHLVSAVDCYAEPAPLSTRLMLTLQKLLNLVGMIPFVWYCKKVDIHDLFAEHAFVIEDTEVLHPAPVNYYVLARKDG